MYMKAKFETLHTAIVDVLERRGKSSFEEISLIIKTENLWKRKSDGAFPEAFQIKLRTTVNKRYKTMFKIENENYITLNKL